LVPQRFSSRCCCAGSGVGLSHLPLDPSVPQADQTIEPGKNALRQLAADAGLVVECLEGAVLYPPVARLARVMAPLDRWLGYHILFGAAFLVVAANKPSLMGPTLPHTEPYDHPAVAPMRRRNPAP